jgi:hypothetical protein
VFADHSCRDFAFGEGDSNCQSDQTTANDDYFGAQLISSSETGRRGVA